jgi:hypothetical protein
MILKQITDQKIPILLTLSGTPVGGVPFGDVVVGILKPGAAAWVLIPVLTTDWSAVGLGYYMLSLKAADMTVLGPNLLRLATASSMFDTQVINLDIVSRGRDEVQPLNQCLLFGDLIGADGFPCKDEEIIVRIVDFPFSASASLATARPGYTRSNGNGHFELNLLRGATVIIEIPVSGIRKQFIVPDQPSVALVDALNI